MSSQSAASVAIRVEASWGRGRSPSTITANKLKFIQSRIFLNILTSLHFVMSMYTIRVKRCSISLCWWLNSKQMYTRLTDGDGYTGWTRGRFSKWRVFFKIFKTRTNKKPDSISKGLFIIYTSGGHRREIQKSI